MMILHDQGSSYREGAVNSKEKSRLVDLWIKNSTLYIKIKFQLIDRSMEMYWIIF